MIQCAIYFLSVHHLPSTLSFILSYAELAEKREHPETNKLRSQLVEINGAKLSIKSAKATPSFATITISIILLELLLSAGVIYCQLKEK